jgi:hypothetical protein
MKPEYPEKTTLVQLELVLFSLGIPASSPNKTDRQDITELVLFSLGTPASSPNKTDRHDIIELVLFSLGILASSPNKTDCRDITASSIKMYIVATISLIGG